MKALRIYAGPAARAHIAASGLAPQDVRTVPGAAGGPKGLILGPIDRFLFGEWLPQTTQPVDLVPGWLDKGLKWRHKPTHFLARTVVLAPDPAWVRQLHRRRAGWRTNWPSGCTGAARRRTCRRSEVPPAWRLQSGIHFKFRGSTTP